MRPLYFECNKNEAIALASASNRFSRVLESKVVEKPPKEIRTVNQRTNSFRPIALTLPHSTVEAHRNGIRNTTLSLISSLNHKQSSILAPPPPSHIGIGIIASSANNLVADLRKKKPPHPCSSRLCVRRDEMIHVSFPWIVGYIFTSKQESRTKSPVEGNTKPLQQTNRYPLCTR